jgi:hypothetical protein
MENCKLMNLNDLTPEQKAERSRQMSREWKARNADRVRQLNKEYRQRADVKAKRRKYQADFGKRQSSRWAQYKAEIDPAATLETRKYGVCDICGNPETTLGPTGKVKLLAIDHDHLTGKVRGLLCARCNQGIGLFSDSPERLEKAIGYLRRFKDERMAAGLP